MCIECPEHGSQASVTDNVKAALAFLGVATVAVATYRVLEVIWPLYLVLLVAAYVWVYAGKQIRAAVRHARRARAERPEPAEYQATLFVRYGDTMHVLAEGPIPGTWASASEAESEVIARYLAAHGAPAGELTCAAEPVRTSEIARRPR